MFEAIVVIIGLSLFEIISSIDNAVVNAHILSTMTERFRRFFLIWGMLIAVFLLRGVLPFVIVWIANPNLSFSEMVSLVFSGDSSEMAKSFQHSKAYLLLGGGMYLVLVFLSWLFLEEKKYTFLVEHFIHRHSVWFYAITSIFFTLIVYISIQFDAFLAFAASIGTTAFFITDGFKKNAEEKEKELLDPAMSGWSKVMYLEVLDASFSIDGVVGAFAFTMSVPLILIGNGIGAFVVREVTVRGINWISKYAYLKNGAMYSIGMLGAIMILESFGEEVPFWIAPLNTIILLAIFLFLSWREIKLAEKLEAEGKGGAV